MSRPVRLALVGLGYWGPHFARIAIEHETADLVWCCDQHEPALDLPRRRYPQVGRTTLFQDVLDDSSVDAVVIATPTATHADLAVAALEAGKHVLVEKPLAASSEEIDRIAAARGDRVVMVGHTFVYNSAIAAIRELVATGELGRVQYLDSTRAALGPIRHDVNALWDLGAHDVSIFLDVLPGRPVVVNAIAQDFLREGHPDVVYVGVRFDDGVLAHSHVSWLDPYKVRRMTVVGDERMAVFDDVAPDERLKILERGASYEGPAQEARGKSFGEYRAVLREGTITIPRLPGASRCRRSSRSFSTPSASGVSRIPGSSGARGRPRARGRSALTRERWRYREARGAVPRTDGLVPGAHAEHVPLRHQELGRAAARDPVEPAGPAQLPVRYALDCPTAALHCVNDVAPSEPPQVCPVTMAPVGVAERTLEDEVRHERHVPRVRQRNLQSCAESRDAMQPAHDAPGSTRCSRTSRQRIVSKGPSSSSRACSTGAATTSS